MQLELEVSNYNLGASAFENGNYTESVLYYTNAIADNPLIEFSLAYLWRGLAYYFLKDYQKAIQDLNEANSGLQNELKIHNWRGLSYKELGKYQEAIKDLKLAIEIEPRWVEPHVDLCELGLLVENLHLSNEYFNRLSVLDRNNISLVIQRADDNEKHGRYELALKMCNFILSIIKNEKRCLQIRGICNAKLMNYGLARNDFNKIIELYPDDATGYFNRAILLREVKKDGANKDFLQAYELGLPEAKNFITG